jgi:hypothetical protein
VGREEKSATYASEEGGCGGQIISCLRTNNPTSSSNCSPWCMFPQAGSVAKILRSEQYMQVLLRCLRIPPLGLRFGERDDVPLSLLGRWCGDQNRNLSQSQSIQGASREFKDQSAMCQVSILYGPPFPFLPGDADSQYLLRAAHPFSLQTSEPTNSSSQQWVRLSKSIVYQVHQEQIY